MWPLQLAIVARLREDISCPVHDEPDEGLAMPYVTVGNDTAVDWSDKLEPGQEVTATLHVWSEYRGMKEVKEIIGEVIEAMTSAPFDLTAHGFAITVAELDLNECFIDPDKTRRGVLRFRFKIAEV